MDALGVRIFDGYKPNKIAILPITHERDKYKDFVGRVSEPLSLYKYRNNGIVAEETLKVIITSRS
jgi:hypothetical protein